MSNHTSTIRGLLIDLDGTVWQDGRPLPGAGEAIAKLRSRGLSLRFTTNTTRKPRAALAERLSEFGIPTRLEEIHTAPLAAADWLRKRGLSRAKLLIAEETFPDFAGIEPRAEEPQAIVIGDLGSSWTFDILNDAFHALLAGAEFVALQKARFWRTGDELVLDAGPFVAALEYAVGQPATVVGKPNAEFFDAAVESLELARERIAVVGDDLSTDVAGARDSGLAAIAVRTGKFRDQDEAAAQRQALGVVDSLAQLPEWLETRT